MAFQILLVEDDVDLAATLIDYLEMEDMQLDYMSNGAGGLEAARGNRYDVIVLDVSLPRMDGLEVCDALRSDGIDTPVLMLTARDSLTDKIAGFRAGTDDYLVKPFEMDELVVRLKSLARRRSGQSRRLVAAGLVLDLDRGRVQRDGRELKLSPTGWILLEKLMRASPNVVSRRELADAVWGDDPPDSDSLKVHIHRLRQEVETGFGRHLIRTVPGRGLALRGSDEKT